MRKHEGEVCRTAMRKMCQEIINIFRAIEFSEQLKLLVQLPQSQSLSEKDLDLQIQQINHKIDKKFKVLLRSHER